MRPRRRTPRATGGADRIVARFLRSIAADRVRAIRIALRAGDCAGAERRLNTLYSRKKHHEVVVKASTIAQLSRRFADRCPSPFGRTQKRRRKRR